MSDSRYCAHGTYIGDPYGPDYLCHYCEAGYSDEEYAALRLWDLKRPILQMLFRQQRHLRAACQMLDVVRDAGIEDPAIIARINQYSLCTD